MTLSIRWSTRTAQCRALSRFRSKALCSATKGSSSTRKRRLATAVRRAQKLGSSESATEHEPPCHNTILQQRLGEYCLLKRCRGVRLGSHRHHTRPCSRQDNISGSRALQGFLICQALLAQGQDLRRPHLSRCREQSCFGCFSGGRTGASPFRRCWQACRSKASRLPCFPRLAFRSVCILYSHLTYPELIQLRQALAVPLCLPLQTPDVCSGQTKAYSSTRAHTGFEGCAMSTPALIMIHILNVGTHVVNSICLILRAKAVPANNFLRLLQTLPVMS